MRILLVTAAAWLLLAAPAAAAPGLATGFQDGDLERLGGAGELEAGLANARRTGATVWRFGVVWRDDAQQHHLQPVVCREPLCG